ncbi:DUF4810 domain-containing protein, partial [Pseudomonadota bacterium]|nr:DUF4810 domain-containing protein [Pseudomonadota bacterium]
QAESEGKKTPPGIYAHLGFMYAILGNVENSTASFAEEKRHFPESSVLIDKMMNRAIEVVTK